MDLDIDDIKKNYENFDDDKLIRLATYEINSLRPEVVPILIAEIKKRNLSLEENKSYSKEQFNNLFAKEKIYYSKEQIEYFKSTIDFKKASFNEKVFFIKNGLRFVTSILFTIICVLLFKNVFRSGIRIIVFSIILALIINFILKASKLGKVAELQNNKVVFSKYPIGNFNIFRILVMVRVTLNALVKIEVNYRNIIKVYQKNELFNKGYYVTTFDKQNNKPKENRIYLEGLNKNELNEFLNSLKYKCISS